jgi:nucleoside-diphosphate-sugar epimerase
MHLSTNIIAITGATGYLGRVLTSELARTYSVRAADCQAPSDPALLATDDFVAGDVCDPAVCERIVNGAHALVISHMFPRIPGAYDHPRQPLEVNSVATATLLEAAAKAGCNRIVLISSTAVVSAHASRGTYLSRDLPLDADSFYGLSKVLQEQIAMYYHRNAGLNIAMLRPAYVTDEDSLTDKYGRTKATVNWQFIDRRDIASAAAAAIELDDLGCEAFYVLGHADADQKTDVAYTRSRLGWQPKYTFGKYPNDAA